ncbi:hypothetical protein IKO18_01385 [bacterium]|nr:hypothetical protein [bacterium]
MNAVSLQEKNIDNNIRIRKNINDKGSIEIIKIKNLTQSIEMHNMKSSDIF